MHSSCNFCDQNRLFTIFHLFLDPIDVSDVHNRLKYHRKFSDRRDRLYSARTYIYEGEEKCDENMKVFLQCIDTTGSAVI